ncbi:unnamed protein product [Brassica oleracea var. botrytis]
MNFGDFAKNLCLSRSVEPGITENPFVFKPSEELSGSHVRRRCVSSSNHEFAGPSGFSDEKKSHHVPLPSLSNDQVNGSVSGSGSVSSVSSSGSGEDQAMTTVICVNCSRKPVTRVALCDDEFGYIQGFIKGNSLKRVEASTDCRVLIRGSELKQALIVQLRSFYTCFMLKEEMHDVYKKQQLRELAFLTITTQRNV